mmetsp:Transcript_61577/g.148313  ORF Transcript_61577/g.148313 Transcript_61577/m.148313 type:complete len:183 (+) Transcript_61577:130-678(+)
MREYVELAWHSSEVCVPCSTSKPSDMTRMRSASTTVCSLCATSTVVTLALAALSTSTTERSMSGSSALVASSHSSSAGRLSSARATATRCRSPPESAWPRSPTRASKPPGVRSAHAVRPTCSAAVSARSRLAEKSPYWMLYSSESSKRIVSCGTSASCSRSERTETSRRSCPSSVTAPLSGS